MSAEPQPLQPATPELQDGRIGSRSWPETRLASSALAAGLGIALALPVLMDGGRTAPQAGGMVLPVLLAMLAARHTFSSRTVRARGVVTAGAVVATVPPALLAVAIVASASLVAGIDLGAGVLAGSVAATVAVLCGAAVLRAVEVRYLLNARRVFLIANEDQRRDVEGEMRRDGGLDLVGFARVGAGGALQQSAESLLRALAQSRPTMLVMSSEASRSDAVVSAASRFHLAGGRVRDLNGFYERHFRKVPLSELTPSWFLFDVAEIHRPRLYLAFKRGVEILAAAAGLLVAGPVLVAAATAIKLESGGPVLFRQLRVGKDGHPFWMLKLRTMHPAPPGAAPAWASAERLRITTVGRWLRRWRLDELPQLWNVLRGQLSLVGPRPEQVTLVERLEQRIPFYSARHRVRPGLTGWAQVNYGYGGSDRGALEKLQFDFYYIRHQSLRLDLLVILMTLRAVLRGDPG